MFAGATTAPNRNAIAGATTAPKQQRHRWRRHGT
jgi:hypothetical protein